MKIEYEREMNSCSMKIYSDEEPDFSMKMVSENNIPELLSVTPYSLDNRTVYKYKINSLISAEDLYERQEIAMSELQGLTLSIAKVINSVNEFLLDENAIILEPDKIFREINGSKWFFTYYCGNDKKFDESLRSLAEYLIQRVDHKDNAAVTYAYGIYKKICAGNMNPEDVFTYEKAEEKEEGEIITEKVVNKNILPEIVKTEIEEPNKIRLYAVYGGGVIVCIIVLIGVTGLIIGKNRTTFAGILILAVAVGFFGFRWYRENRSMFYRVKTVCEEVPYETENVRVIVPSSSKKDMTVVLNKNIMGNLELHWNDNGTPREFNVDDNIIILGSSEEKADCVMSSPGISRMHARISKEGDKYFIKDLNSTNGTKVNNKELACFELCEIKKGDKIYLGNTECVVM